MVSLHASDLFALVLNTLFYPSTLRQCSVIYCIRDVFTPQCHMVLSSRRAILGNPVHLKQIIWWWCFNCQIEPIIIEKKQDRKNMHGLVSDIWWCVFFWGNWFNAQAYFWKLKYYQKKKTLGVAWLPVKIPENKCTISDQTWVDKILAKWCAIWINRQADWLGKKVPPGPKFY